MARTYKQGRVIGSRPSNYAEKVFLGFVFPKRGNLRGEKYLQEFVRRNEQLIQKQYEAAEVYASTQGGEALARFKQYNPTTFHFTKNKFIPEGGKQFYNRETITNVIKYQLATSSQKSLLHIKDLIETDAGFYDELKLEANEKIDYNRITYQGNNIYQYINKKGKIIKFEFIEYSDENGHSRLRIIQ